MEQVAKSLYGSYLSLSAKSFAVENSSANAQNVINVGTYVHYRVFSIVSIVTEAFTMLLLISAMSTYSPIFIFPVVIVTGIAATVIFKFTIDKVRMSGEIVTKHTKIRNRILNESLRNLDEIQVFGNQKYFLKLFSEANNLVVTGDQRYEENTGLAPISIELSALFIFSVIFGIQIAGGVSTATLLASVGVLLIGALRLIPSLGRIVSELQKQGYGFEAKFAIQRDMDRLGEGIQENWDEASFIKEFRELESVVIDLKDVEHFYSSRTVPSFSRLNLIIDGKKLFGIRGTSGSGKSTLLRLILGIYRPTSGTVCVNGVEIGNDLVSWRSKIGYVPQSIFFLDGTVRENIIFGGEELENRHMFETLEKAGLIDFIESLPDGIETNVGENGESFSGGQRQRLGIARALYRKPSVLIMDEPTSALDAVATTELVETLKELSGSVLVLAASHDEILLSRCDQIFDLNNHAHN
jgi:ABC-type multidrug transport system fused ATPase/permease subunit